MKHLNCGGEYEWDYSCAAQICDECNDHFGLDRCYCDWARSGRSGIQELEAMGEIIDDDEGEY